MPVVALWSSPRSRSTAFFRSMVERGDVLALHEPLWELLAFGETEVDGRRFDSHTSLLTWLRDETDAITVFTKETTDHRYESVLADRGLLAEARHVFLIRRPDEIVASYYALWPEMRMEEVGLETMHEMHTAVLAAGGHQPIVIDSDDLAGRPEATMAAFCSAVDLRFIPEALTWEPGDRVVWQKSASWHVEASTSSGFVEQTRTYADNVKNSDKLARFAAHHRPFYDQLHATRLDVTQFG